MVQIWFGNTYLSVEQATSFHPLFGPILMTSFAILSNTLLLTSKLVSFISHFLQLTHAVIVLISILSNTVASINTVRVPSLTVLIYF
jgi:hypothetical protein